MNLCELGASLIYIPILGQPGLHSAGLLEETACSFPHHTDSFIPGWWWLLQDFGELENFANLLVRKTPLAATGKVH